MVRRLGWMWGGWGLVKEMEFCPYDAPGGLVYYDTQKKKGKGAALWGRGGSTRTNCTLRHTRIRLKLRDWNSKAYGHKT